MLSTYATSHSIYSTSTTTDNTLTITHPQTLVDSSATPWSIDIVIFSHRSKRDKSRLVLGRRKGESFFLYAHISDGICSQDKGLSEPREHATRRHFPTHLTLNQRIRTEEISVPFTVVGLSSRAPSVCTEGKPVAGASSLQNFFL